MINICLLPLKEKCTTYLKWKRNILTYLHIELYPGWNSSSWTCTDSWDEKQVQQLEKHCGLESPHKRMLSFMFHT